MGPGEAQRRGKRPRLEAHGTEHLLGSVVRDTATPRPIGGPMDKEAAEIIAAALNNVATSSAIQAETNAVLAAQMERMTRTVQAHQFVKFL